MYGDQTGRICDRIYLLRRSLCRGVVRDEGVGSEIQTDRRPVITPADRLLYVGARQRRRCPFAVRRFFVTFGKTKPQNGAFCGPKGEDYPPFPKQKILTI